MIVLHLDRTRYLYTERCRYRESWEKKQAIQCNVMGFKTLSSRNWNILCIVEYVWCIHVSTITRWIWIGCGLKCGIKSLYIACMEEKSKRDSGRLLTIHFRILCMYSTFFAQHDYGCFHRRHSRFRCCLISAHALFLVHYEIVAIHESYVGRKKNGAFLRLTFFLYHMLRKSQTFIDKRDAFAVLYVLCESNTYFLEFPL